MNNSYRCPKRLVFDIEADSLTPTIIWCVCVIDVDTNEEWTFDNVDSFLDFHDQFGSSIWIGHNAIGYDSPAIEKLGRRSRWSVHRIIDTLVCSRLFNFSVHEGHSLDAWGKRLGLPKGEFNEWGAYDDPILELDRRARCRTYCLQDCRITASLFRKLEKAIYSETWRKALRVEHEAAIVCRELHDNGFRFDYQAAKSIHEEISRRVEQLLGELREAFPPKSRLIREITPRSTKFGTLAKGDFRWVEDGDLSVFQEGWSFSRIEFIPFNPGSPKQVVEVLNEAGWAPFDKTEGHKEAEKELSTLQRLPKAHRDGVQCDALRSRLQEYETYGWKVSEENLETLPEDAPEGTRLLVKWRMLSKRLQTLDEWLNHYNTQTKAIHSEFAHIGTWTHRKSHSKPNMGNVPSMDSKYHNEELKKLAYDYGKAMRSCFHVDEDEVLVGVDADGIQLRILAHYMDDPEFTEALVNGDKDRGTDAHTINAIALGIGAGQRARAKTFIYAWLLGAGTAKVAKILGLTNHEAGIAIESFIRRYEGLHRLKEHIIPIDAKRGWFEGFDGRLIRCDEYHMLAGYLQCGESVIMKHSAVLWRKELDEKGIWYKQVNDVHDEWQTATKNDNVSPDIVAREQVRAIVDTGRNLILRCPLAGTAKFGRNWMETH